MRFSNNFDDEQVEGGKTVRYCNLGKRMQEQLYYWRECYRVY